MAFVAITTFSGGTKPVDSNHFLLHGKIMEINPTAMQESAVDNSQVIVMQDNELYVVFNSDEKGKYEFNLPVNHNYTIIYGSQSFVVKKVEINAHDLSKSRYGHNVKLDLGLFKSVEGVDFSFLEEPIAKFQFEPEFGKIAPDEDYSFQMSKRMRKCFKKIAKTTGA
jgi:hypothetical protein